jgi:HlyD family secretion protein
MKSRTSSIATFVFVGALFGLGGVVVTRAFAGPQTVPNEKDVKKSERVSQNPSGVDEAADVPAGKFVAGNGIVEPADREIRVSAALAGRISRIVVKEGDFVEAGAVLAELDNTVEKAALQAAEADIIAARAETKRTSQGLRREDVDAVVADAEALHSKAELSASSLKRISELAQGGAATPDELDKARRQAEIDQKNLSAAEARQKAAVAGGWRGDITVAQAKELAAMSRRDQARATLARLEIKAPIAGQVLQVKARAGEYYNPQGTEALLILGDTRKLRVRMDVDERDVAAVKLGARAFARLSAFPKRDFGGKVSEVGKRMGRKNVRTDDPTERIDTKILEVVIDLDSPKDLVPGLRVTSYVALE